MSEQDLNRGLRALEDDAIREKVAKGDLSSAGDLDLTDEERDLLVAAASDYPDVVGFGINAGLLSLGGLSVGQKDLPGITANKAKTSEKVRAAMNDFLKG